MTLHNKPLSIFLLASMLLGIAVAGPSVAHAATIVIINNDGPGEGFNDPIAAAPVGGNTGTTIGAQRLIAFQRAADIWAARLSSSVPIRVRAQFNSLSCTANSAILGSAGPVTAHRDFSGAPVAGTYFVAAEANSLNGSDLSANDDINATFSSTIGTPGCLENSGWYYGLDGNTPGNRIDFVSVLIHELGHGLGFLSLVDLASGAKFNGFNDTYMRFLENHGASPSDYPSMSDAERVTASKATGNLHWTGANVRSVSGLLSAGAVSDHVRMYAPNPQQSGSSVSHFDTVLTPNQVMEPSYTGPLHNPILEMPLFKDIGWTVPAKAHDFDGGFKSDILWRHSGGSVAMWLMNGGTITSSLVVGSVGTDWTIVGTANNITGTGDFDGDGKADILWRHTGGNVAIWEMNGGTVKATQGVGWAGTDWQIAGVGDFDGDGKADILWRHTGGTVAIWEMNGFTVKASLNVGFTGTDWQIAGIGDFDGDGKADVLWRHTGGSVTIWEMNGGTVKASLGVGFVGTDWQIAGVGDFDGDGKSDILWRHTGGSVAIWEMNGGTIKASLSVGSAGSDWTIISVGDYDFDAKADILWRQTGGSVALWEMNGNLIKASLGVGSAATTWQIVE